MAQGLEDVSGLLELAVEADDEETFNEAVAELDVLEEKLASYSGHHAPKEGGKDHK